MSIEAMKQALEFLEAGNFVYPAKLAEDLRQAIAQAEQAQPVARQIRMERTDESKSAVWWNEAARIKQPSPDLYKHGDTILCWVNEGDYYALHTAPPRQPEQAKKKEPVTLTDALNFFTENERLAIWMRGYSEAAIANITQAVLSKLYNAPPSRQPLTDEQIDKVTDAQWSSNNHKPIYAAHRAYARAIEAAHGIEGDA